MAQVASIMSMSDDIPWSDNEPTTDLESLPKKTVGAPAIYEENCPACRGSGNFYSYAGRYIGPCRKCNGTGKLKFGQPAVVREANRQRAAERKVNQAACNIKRLQSEHPAEFEWLTAAMNRGNEFASSLMQAVEKYGRLTDNQLAAVQRIIERDVQQKAERHARVANAPECDAAKITESINSAKSAGLKYISLRLSSFVFKPASDAGKNAGKIWVTENEVFLGGIDHGKFVKSRECTDDQEHRILEVAADPLAAAVAYGKNTGRCSCCGRELTNQESIDLGIGPICREKFGW